MESGETQVAKVSRTLVPERKEHQRERSQEAEGSGIKRGLFIYLFLRWEKQQHLDGFSEGKNL